MSPQYFRPVETHSQYNLPFEPGHFPTMKKIKSKCCKKYRKKAKVCSSCPLRQCLNKKERKKLIGRFHSKKKAA